MYYCYRPGEQHAAGRPVRKSSLFERLGEAGAQFQQVMGWERPRWYDKSGAGERYSFRRSNWWQAVREECLAVRNGVGLMDLSSFAKFDLRGTDAQAVLSRLCANRIPSRDGGIVLAHMLTAAGFIESEFTITRLAPDHYYLLSAAPAELQDEDRLRQGLPADSDCTLDNVTESYGTLILAGPRSREVLGPLTESDLGNAAFPWLTGRIITVAGVDGVRALRINYVGELGYELHCRMAAMPSVFEALMREGARYGVKLFGTYAMNALRMEKAYRAWGGELTNEVTMIEGSMERFVDFRKDFIGKAGTLRSKQEGPRLRLVYLEVAASDSDCRGNEPLYHDDRLVGITTGGAYGHAVEKSLAFAYVEPELATMAGELAVELYGVRHAARIIAEPAYDPDNARLKG
jgi:dimethylglycine dehydrogenase